MLIKGANNDVTRGKRVDVGGRLSETRLLAPTRDDSIAYDDRILIEKENMFILLALKEFCLNNPRECRPDHPNFAPFCGILGDHLKCGGIGGGPPARVSPIPRGTRDENQVNGSLPLSEPPSDGLDDGQSWAPRLEAMDSERDVGTQEGYQRTLQKITDLLTGYERALAEGARKEGAGGLHLVDDNVRKPGRGLFKRDQAQANGRRVAPSTYRVTLEEARRLIRAHQRQQQIAIPPLTNSILFTPGLLGRRQAAGRSSSINNNGGHLMIVPKRTDSSANSRSESGISGTLSGSKLADHQPEEPEKATTSTRTSSKSSTMQPFATDESGDDSLKCNMRKFTYRATKTDEQGNQCTGFIMTSICYGGCDTGEIADWLFPHKKSIHKVCRHGGRARRQARLNNCTSATGNALAAEDLESLSLYHYVDALDCVCKKCTPADTTCLGTLSRPHLQTLNEAVGEMGQQQHQQQQSAPLLMAFVDSEGVGGD